MSLGKEVGLGPGHIVLDWDPAPLPRKKRETQPLTNFRPMSVVAERYRRQTTDRQTDGRATANS